MGRGVDKREAERIEEYKQIGATRLVDFCFFSWRRKCPFIINFNRFTVSLERGFKDIL